MYRIKFVLTIQITLMTVITYTELLMQLYLVFEGKIKAVGTVAKSKPIVLVSL